MLFLTMSMENLTDRMILFDNLLSVLLTYMISKQKESACFSVQDENQDKLMHSKRLYLYNLFTLVFQFLMLK